jgi:lipopolysaccharide heptosyltransferase II
MRDPVAWDGVRRILCVRLDSLGDVLLTTPAIRALKASADGRWIALLTSPAGAAAAALVPEVDEVIVYDAPWMKATTTRNSSLADHAMINRLRRRGFEAAVIFTVYSQNPLPAALLCHLADIPLRAAHCRENPYQLLTNWVPEREPDRGIRHEVRRQLDLVATLGAHTADTRLSLRVPDDARERVHRLLQAIGLDQGGRWAVVHPGASAPSRRYPPEAFAVVVRRLVSELGCEVLLTGTQPEEELVAHIQQASGVRAHVLAGCLNLGDLGALLEVAPLLIANNTGPVHVAAAVGAPVVVLYALTNPQHTPWGVPARVLSHDVPCRYCYRSVCPQGHHHCLRLVSPQAVIDAATDLFAARAAGDASAPAVSLASGARAVGILGGENLCQDPDRT